MTSKYVLMPASKVLPGDPVIRLELFVPAPLKLTRSGKLTANWANSNDRYKHWSQKAERTAAWRERGYIRARAADLPKLSTATINAYVHKTNRTTYDAGNLYPSVKAIIDGLVGTPRHPGYGLLPDDSNEYLSGPFLHPGEKRDTPGITLIIEGEPLA